MIVSFVIRILLIFLSTFYSIKSTPFTVVKCVFIGVLSKTWEYSDLFNTTDILANIYFVFQWKQFTYKANGVEHKTKFRFTYQQKSHSV